MRTGMIVSAVAALLLLYVTCAAQFIGGNGGAP